MNRLYDEDNIRDIAVAIREKNGTENTYNVSEMGDAIRAIQVDNGGITPTGSIEITSNGTHNVTEYANAIVNVPVGSGGITPTGSIDITENGTYDVTNFASAVVNILSSGPTIFSSFKAGIYVPEEEIGFATLPNTKPGSSLEIEHNLGVVPDIAFLLNITPEDSITAPELILSGKTPTTELAMCYRNAEKATTNIVGNEGKYCTADENKVTFAGNGSTTYALHVGHKYLWIVAKE